jgi:hypothetical protein
MELPFYQVYSNSIPNSAGIGSSNNPNAGAPNQLKVEEAFSGVNYLMATVNTQDVNQLLDQQSGPQSSAHSIFNKFTVFQYSGLNAGFAYQEGGHFIGYNTGKATRTDELNVDNRSQYVNVRAKMDAEYRTSLMNAKTSSEKTNVTESYNNAKNRLTNDAAESGKLNGLDKFSQQALSIMSNPTAKKLVKWGAEVSPSTVYGFQPYSMTDFMFCKYYGRIPNNRLITLRRYPHPVSDSVRLGQKEGVSGKRSAIPVAQAVTWFGSETGNQLNKIGVFSWDMPWDQGGPNVTVDTQEITGNEITLNELFSLASGLTGSDSLKNFLLSGYVSLVDGSDASMTQFSKYEEVIQNYQKNLYTTGPYWNRIYGPVNVIHESSRRRRGIQSANWKSPFTIKFHYSFRSFNGLSPKIVALDLISNFLNLTYNDAQFLNQLSRYFPKLGVKPDPTVAETLGNLITSWGTTFSGNSSTTFLSLLQTMIGAMDEAGSKIMTDPGKMTKQALQTILMSRLSNALPQMLSVKSALSDRPIGEWHITIGNPTNPIFVMGDLIVTNTSMTWDEEMGPDDFPSGCTFDVTLSQGKPRDKTAIERMLNLGDTKLTAGTLRTSSYDDTFGEDNNKKWNEIQTQITSPETIKDQLSKLKADEPASPFSKFRNRFRTGYGLRYGDDKTNNSGNTELDDNILLLYFQRNYGNN